MKPTLFITAAICLALITSCKKGDQGDPGTDGNANAVQYNFGPHNFATSYAQLKINTTADTMNNSSWHVYMYNDAVTRWYGVPGEGQGGATSYRVSIGYLSGQVNIYIDKSGPGETYSKIRVIRIYSNKQENLGLMPGNRNISGPDISSYESMRAFYQLP
jgi:hypothetical protein